MHVQATGKRIASSLEGKSSQNNSECQEVYMSLERKGAKKQYVDLTSAQSSAKRENHFSKITSNPDPKSLKLKVQGNPSMTEDMVSDRFRKATLSPP
jgi:hypothetical protein